MAKRGRPAKQATAIPGEATEGVVAHTDPIMPETETVGVDETVKVDLGQSNGAKPVEKLAQFETTSVKILEFLQSKGIEDIECFGTPMIYRYTAKDTKEIKKLLKEEGLA